MRGKTSILLLVLLISASGLTLNKHYCNGELVNVFLLPHFGDCCDSSMPMGEDSCEDEFLGFEVEGSLALPVPRITLTHSNSIGQIAESSLVINSNDIKFVSQKLSLSAPPLANIKIYLRVESFLN